MEEILKHWGIFGMKWGVRNYQNPDGSLTPEGRLRYGVGPARGSTKVGADMSDSELKDMTNRYRRQADFYEARNRYIQAEERYKQLSAPKKNPTFVTKFLDRFLLNPLGNVMEKNVEFGLSALGASFVEGTGSKYSDKYVNYIFRYDGDKKKKNKNNNSNNYQNNNLNRNNNWNRNNNNDDDDDDD